MNAPPQAVAGLVWAIIAPPVLVFAATRVRRGQLSLHAALMLSSLSVELAVFTAFMFLMPAGPRRDALSDLPFFKIHLAFAIAAFAGMAWQVLSRVIARLRPLHRHSGPYVVLVWCLALLTGIYNFVFLYAMHTS